jgi:hypothetical protein
MKLTKQESAIINLVTNILLEGLIDGAEEQDDIVIKVSDERIKELRELLNETKLRTSSRTPK